MGKLRVCLVGILAVAACGSDSGNKTVDAAGTGIDAPPDSKVFLDAAVDAPPQYDFSCFGQPPPTTAPATVSASGTTETLSSSLQLTPVTSVSVSACPSSSLTCPANGPGKALATTTSSATDGTFTLSNVATGGVPLDAYIKAAKTGERTTFLYPDHPIAANVSMVPVFMLDSTQLGLLSQFAGQTQDPANGLFVIIATDCQNNPISGATITVQQAGVDVGTQFSNPMLMGAVFVFNVPPNATTGGTTVGASYMGMTFPTVATTSFAGGDTATRVRPGP